MAQLIAKGYIADIKQEQVGKENKIDRTRITLVDDTRKKKVSFFIDFWQENSKLLANFKKGSRVIVKAFIDDNSYVVKDEKGNDTDKKIFSLQYTGTGIVEVAEPGDLDDEFNKAQKS